jgi:hypothetical protein
MRWKATLSAVVFLGILGMTLPSAAEVQNVKVGGDITVRSFNRECVDLNCGDDFTETGAVTGVAGDSEDAFLMSTVGVNVGADLTENVSAFIRLASERDWNVDGGNSGDFDLSQAYVRLHEFLYSPLSLTIGQQPIRWGRGFVLGSNLIPGTILGGGDRNGAISANEFTEFTAFDAIRATLDLSNLGAVTLPPLSLDMVYIKLDENTTGQSDDVNLMGFNLSSRISDETEVETYYINKRDKNTLAVAPTDNDGSVNTIGVRGSIKAMESALFFGEAAYQFGKRATDPAATLIAGDSQQAWAFNLGTEYTLGDVQMSPKLGAEWIFWSGKDADSAINGWDPIARGYFTTALREFQVSNNGGPFFGTPQLGDTSAATNQHQLSLYGSLSPIEDLTISPRVTWFILDVGAVPFTVAQVNGATPVQGDGARSRYAGFEWDTSVVYNYTDDVQLGLIYALFAPGSVYRHPNDATAQELITSVSLKF